MRLFLDPPANIAFRPPEEWMFHSQSCCWKSPERHELSPALPCCLGEGGEDTQGICPLYLLYDIKERHMQAETHVALYCLCSCGSEYNAKVLPSVLHLNAMTVKAPPILFSTTSQSASMAWWKTKNHFQFYNIISTFTFPWLAVDWAWQLLYRLWYAVAPSSSWVWLCSWQQALGPAHGILFPAAQFLGHIRLRPTKRGSKEEIWDYHYCYQNNYWDYHYHYQINHHKNYYYN